MPGSFPRRPERFPEKVTFGVLKENLNTTLCPRPHPFFLKNKNRNTNKQINSAIATSFLDTGGINQVENKSHRIKMAWAFKKLFCSTEFSVYASSCKHLKDRAVWGNHVQAKCFSLPEVRLNGGKEGSLRVAKKNKRENWFGKRFSFSCWGPDGFVRLHKCLSGVLSDDSMAPTAVRNTNAGRPGITDKARSGTVF